METLKVEYLEIKTLTRKEHMNFGSFIFIPGIGSKIKYPITVGKTEKGWKFISES